MKLRQLFLALIVSTSLLGFSTTTTGFALTTSTKVKKYTFHHDGYTRNYSVYYPKVCKNYKSVPLVMALHGGGGAARKWPKYTNHGFERLAESAPFILVYPNGLKKQWNDGRDYSQSFAHKNRIDDLGFLSRLIDYLLETYPIDPNKVFVTGPSNGGIMSHYLAAMHSEKIAAIAPVIASISEKMLPQFNPTSPLSVLMINGKQDPLVKWEGGMIQLGKKKNGKVIPVEQAVNYWVEHNQCQAKPKFKLLPDRDPQDGTRVVQRTYSGGQSGTEVILYAIKGGGHEWPTYQDKRRRAFKRLMDKVVGIRSRDIDACQIIWEFFKNHPKNVHK